MPRCCRRDRRWPRAWSSWCSKADRQRSFANSYWIYFYFCGSRNSGKRQMPWLGKTCDVLKLEVKRLIFILIESWLFCQHFLNSFPFLKFSLPLLMSFHTSCEKCYQQKNRKVAKSLKMPQWKKHYFNYLFKLNKIINYLKLIGKKQVY